MLLFTEKNTLQQVVLTEEMAVKAEMLYSKQTEICQLLWISDTKENTLRKTEVTEQEKNVIFGGRLGEYKYYDMDQVITAALKCAGEIMTGETVK